MTTTDLPDFQGTVTFTHPLLPQDKPCQTFYRVVGHLKSGKRPLVALHGGPGGLYNYMYYGTINLATRFGIPLVLYDQIGGGQSTHYPEKNGDKSFWTIELFTAELDNILTHLEIKSDFDLLGHSWGSMLAAEYALAYQSGMKHLVISSGPASMLLWANSARRCVNQLPTELARLILEADEKEKWDEPE
jgi:proline-specific peptidase